MRLLIISPDYLSHYLPLSAIAEEAASWDVDVIVATGDALEARVVADGSSWRPLRMSRGSNAGVARHDDPDDDLTAFFRATASGMVPTLLQQASARRQDLLWNPVEVGRAVLNIVDEVRPDAILVDHLAFASTMALRANGIRFATFVPGHPSQLPAPGERYGYPVAWPPCERPDPDALAELRDCCDEVAASFTADYCAAAALVGHGVGDIDDAFAVHGDDVLYNSPTALQPPLRPLPDVHAFLGSCVRTEPTDGDLRTWFEAERARPIVYVSFGTFLSARHDVLRRVMVALSTMGVDAVIATGSTPVEALGTLPDTWWAAPVVPQIAVLRHVDAVVCHAGNNTVTESLTFGRPIVALPFSTDQFAIAADLHRTEHGVALNPNRATVHELVDAICWSLDAATTRRTRTLADTLTIRPGPQIAVDRLFPDLR